MQHVHVATSVRPDRVISTGVIQPYPVGVRPSLLALQVVRSFAHEGRPEPSPVTPGMQPEEIATHARRVAAAMSAGTRLPPNTNRLLMTAAQMILAGRPFVIRSAGRAALVKARISPSSWQALVMRNPAYYGMTHPR